MNNPPFEMIYLNLGPDWTFLLDCFVILRIWFRSCFALNISIYDGFDIVLLCLLHYVMPDMHIRCLKPCLYANQHKIDIGVWWHNLSLISSTLMPYISDPEVIIARLQCRLSSRYLIRRCIVLQKHLNKTYIDIRILMS